MARNFNFRSHSEIRREHIVEIIEQPAPKHQRFRYASEVDGSRSVGSIPGVRSTPERKTYPTIRVQGYNGPMFVMVCLINPDDERAHPHAIIGNDQRYRCTNGVISTFVDGPEVSFNNVGVLCVKSKTDEDVTAALNERRLLHIDPFKAGFKHIEDRSLINFNAVRLCFTVYIPEGEIKPEDRENFHKYNINLTPVASTVVYDAKKLNELRIQYVNKSAGSMLGGTEIVILCEKYAGPHPEVVFVEGDWQAKAQVVQYHKQMALVVITPPYKNPLCTQGVPVQVYLQRLSPRGALERSKPANSEYIPVLPKSHPCDIGVKPPPLDYLDIKKRKRPFPEHLSKYMPKTNSSEDCTQHIIDFVLDRLGPLPPMDSDQQGFGNIAGSSSNPPDQQDMPWSQDPNFGTNLTNNIPYSDINPPSSLPINITSESSKTCFVEFDPLPHAAHVSQPPVGLFYTSDPNHMLQDNQFLATIPSNFSSVTQEGSTDYAKSPRTRSTQTCPMPNVIPIASTSYSQEPDLLSHMSQDCVTGSIDNCNPAAGTDDFNIFNHNQVVNNDYQNLAGAGPSVNAAANAVFQEIYPIDSNDDVEWISGEIENFHFD